MCAGFCSMQATAITLSMQKSRINEAVTELRRIGVDTVYDEAREIANFLAERLEDRFRELLDDHERPALMAMYLDPRTMRPLIEVQVDPANPTKLSLSNASRAMLYQSTAYRKCVLDLFAEDLPAACSDTDFTDSTPLKTELGIYVKMLATGALACTPDTDVLKQFCSPVCMAIPLVVKLARSYLPARASVSDADCAFSIGGQIASALRRRMAPELHDALTCLAHDARNAAGAARRHRKHVPSDRIKRAELMLGGMSRKAASVAVRSAGVASSSAAQLAAAGVESAPADAQAEPPSVAVAPANQLAEPSSVDDDSDDDDGEIAYALIERGVPYDALKGFCVADAVLAVESAVSEELPGDKAAGPADSEGCGQHAADLLALLHADVASGLRRSGRQLAIAAAAAEVEAVAPAQQVVAKKTQRGKA